MNFGMTILNQNMETYYNWRFYEDITNDVERWFDTSNFDENDKRPLPIGKNKKVPGLFKDELGGRIVIEFVGIRPKTWAYLIDGYEDDDYETIR